MAYSIVPNKWAIIQAEEEGAPLVIRANLGVAAIRGHHDFAHQLGVAIPLKNPNAVGMPEGDEYTALQAIDALLTKELEYGQESILTLILSGGGVREYVFYTRAPTTVEARVRELAQRIETHELQTVVQHDPEWLVYDSYTP